MPPKRPSDSDLEVLNKKLKAAKDKKANTTRRTRASGNQGATRSSPRKKATVSTEKTKRTVQVNWSDPLNFPLTDLLLSLIEDSSTWRQSFGFSRGAWDDSTVSNASQGKKTITHYQELTTALFEANSPFQLDMKAGESTELVNSVKNRIFTLKKQYRKHRDDLGKTGHGLVVEGKESELTEGSHLANVWDKIQKVYPWYQHMDELVGSSPVIDHGAQANSASDLDTSYLASLTNLDQDNDDEDDNTPSLDHDAADFDASSDVDDSPLPRSSPPPTPSSGQAATTNATPALLPQTTTPAPAKRTGRRNMAETVQNALDSARQVQLAVMVSRNENRLAVEKEKSQTAINLEKMRLEECQRMRDHELKRLELQIRLAELQGVSAGMRPSLQIDPSLV